MGCQDFYTTPLNEQKLCIDLHSDDGRFDFIEEAGLGTIDPRRGVVVMRWPMEDVETNLVRLKQRPGGEQIAGHIRKRYEADLADHARGCCKEPGE